MFNRLKRLMKKAMVKVFGINRRYRFWSKETMLIHETKKGDEKAVEELIKKGADLNIVDSKGKTALMYAAEYSKDKLVDLLLGRGADTQIVDKNKKRALDYGFVGNNKRVIDLLEGREELESIQTINHWEEKEVSNEVLEKQREDVVNKPILDAKENEEKEKREQQLDFSSIKENIDSGKINEKVAVAVEDPWVQNKEVKIDIKQEEIMIDIPKKEQTIEDIKREEAEQAKNRKLEKEILDNPWKDEGRNMF